MAKLEIVQYCTAPLRSEVYTGVVDSIGGGKPVGGTDRTYDYSATNSVGSIQRTDAGVIAQRNQTFERYQDRQA